MMRYADPSPLWYDKVYIQWVFACTLSLFMMAQVLHNMAFSYNGNHHQIKYISRTGPTVYHEIKSYQNQSSLLQIAAFACQTRILALKRSHSNNGKERLQWIINQNEALQWNLVFMEEEFIRKCDNSCTFSVSSCRYMIT